jgi:hypothetical protein
MEERQDENSEDFFLFFLIVDKNEWKNSASQYPH